MTIKPLGDARDHYWMTMKMGDALGRSLVDAWNDGRLTPEGYAAMIAKCRGCSAPDACARLLEGRPALEEAPAYCANADVWERLRLDTSVCIDFGG